METILEKILSYNKAWFGLIFIGSVLNAAALKLGALNNIPNIPNISIWCFFVGFVIGVIAHIRGKWLWI
jgi:hypothetical protein